MMEETVCTYDPNHPNETILRFLCKGLGIGYRYLHVKRFLYSNVIEHYYMIIDDTIKNDDSIYSPWCSCCIFYSTSQELLDKNTIEGSNKLSETLAINEVKRFLETTIKQRYKYLQDKLNEYQC